MGNRHLTKLVLLVLLMISVSCSILSPASDTQSLSTRGTPKPKVRIVRKAYASVVISPRAEEEGLARVEVIPKEIVVLADQPFFFSARSFDASGGLLLNTEYVWRIEDPSVGIIDGAGRFRATSTPGRYNNAVRVEAVQRINGVANKQIAYATVTVAGETKVGPIVRVDVFPREITLTTGQPFVFYALSYDAFGNPVPVVRYEWDVSSSNIGTINDIGFFRAADVPGKHEDVIRVRARQTIDGREVLKEAAVTVTITSAEEARRSIRVDVLPREATIVQGNSMVFLAVAYSETGNLIPRTPYRWSVLNGDVGVINNFGLFRANGDPGAYKDIIRVEALEINEGNERLLSVHYASVEIIPKVIRDRAIEQVNVFPQEIVINPKEQFNFSAIAYDSFHIPLANVQFQWIIEDPEVGTLSERGLFKAKVAPGRYPKSVKVKAVQKLAGLEVVRIAYADVIISGPVDRVEVNPLETTVAAGRVVVFSAKAFDESGTLIPGVSYNWRVLDSRVGTINNAGLFLAGEEPGEYASAIEVEAVQLYPIPDQ